METNIFSTFQQAQNGQEGDHYEEQKNIIVGTSIVSFVIFVIVSGIIATIILKQKHYAEINQIIAERKGEVLRIKKTSQDQSPFLENGSGNIIYKIIYEIKGDERVAWYRGLKTVNNIRKPGRKSKPEAWIFE